nr:unnamed protein product [Callosobruchus chinensis]
MSITSFDELNKILNSKIERCDTNMRKSIVAEESSRPICRYLATGCTFVDMKYSYRCGSTTIGRIFVKKFG